MNLERISSNHIMKIASLFGGVFLLFHIGLVSAATFTANGTPNAETMLVHLTNSVPSLMRLVTAIAYVMGFFFIVKGLLELKKFGEQRTMMSGEHHFGGPLIYIFVGTMLIYLPTSVRTGLATFWSGSVNPYAWKTSATDAWSLLSNSIFLIVELIGVISFIRGLILLSHLGERSGAQGAFGKAMVHIIAGVLCINLYGFLDVISTTLGLGSWSS